MKRNLIKFMGMFVFSIIATISFSSAALGTVLYIPAVKAEPGQSFNVPVMIDHVDNLAGIKLVMKYNTDFLTFKKAVKTRNTSSLMHIVNSKNPGTLVVVMAGARGIKGKDFSIITVTFELKTDLKNKQDTKINITEIQLMSDELKDIKCGIKINPITFLAKNSKTGNLAEKPAVKVVEKPAEKSVKKSAEKSVGKPAVKVIKKPAEKSVKKPAEKPAEKSVEKPAEKSVEKPAEKSVEKPAGKPAGKDIEKTDKCTLDQLFSN
ncbi:MAG: hypothetical protein GY749_04040 [Desulfobacteraceae bacterium]|nr:hypothetical protein [Desulfobacteraceae bacterium]